ncbi:MAG: helix-turn-helix transcriptional regulator [Magnetococcales bacterium]|nr:helix-turn-helix transcriptional regulator [Magnetococcales bacterium]MBF0419859.1 helix-turn-helix transcriptional regulator [Magnetococcales bacterium]
MTSLGDLKEKWMQDNDFKEKYDAIAPEFAIARALIGARVKAGLTQTEVAERMGTTQSVVARLEGGTSIPSLKTLFRYAKATGMKPEITFIPLDQAASAPM